MTLRRIENAVTPRATGFKLKSPHPTTIPLGMKKYNALQRMLPHMPPQHHEFFEKLPHKSDSAAEKVHPDSDSQCQSQNRSSSARKKRIAENDEFLAQFDHYLPPEIQIELEKAEN